MGDRSGERKRKWDQTHSFGFAVASLVMYVLLGQCFGVRLEDVPPNVCARTVIKRASVNLVSTIKTSSVLPREEPK